MRHVQLREQRDVVAVQVRVTAVEADAAPVPAVGEPGAERVLALGEMVGDVVGVVAQPLAVDGPARRQGVVADARSVELHLVQAVGRHVEPGRGHRPRGG